MPIRRNPSSPSPRPSATARPSASDQTRAMIAPTVRQATRISSVAAVLEVRVTSQATCWSKLWVCPALCAAHGTCATTTPCCLQRTRGASASKNINVVPWSNDRHRRRPAPPSYRGHRRRHHPHRSRCPAIGRTCATSTPRPDPSANTTFSTAVPCKPSSPRHRLIPRTPFLHLVAVP